MNAFVTIPCYNEAERLNQESVRALLEDQDVHVVLVDDGSTDRTATLLRALHDEEPGRIHVVELHPNQGKSEAARAGMRRSLELGADIVSYLDADFSTPPREMSRILSALDDPSIDTALGSRIRLLGSDIRRSHWKHYRGRAFATLASLALDLPVYDTQCGAKAMRASGALIDALDQPFRSRWAFDIELLDRLLSGPRAITRSRFTEVPLQSWSDVRGSKLRWTGIARAVYEVLRLAIHRRVLRSPRKSLRSQAESVIS